MTTEKEAPAIPEGVLQELNEKKNKRHPNSYGWRDWQIEVLKKYWRDDDFEHQDVLKSIQIDGRPCQETLRKKIRELGL